MKTPHKHAELIKAWADGAEIECYCVDETWQPVGEPFWKPGTEYRIKPEPKPNVVTWHNVYAGGLGYNSFTEKSQANGEHILRIEIDHNDLDNPVLVSATLEKP